VCHLAQNLVQHGRAATEQTLNHRGLGIQWADARLRA
jgi:hypothetical protein